VFSLDSEIFAEGDLVVEAPRSSARRGYDRAEVDDFVEATRTRLRAMADRLSDQQNELQRLESENRAFSRTIDIAVTAAEEVMAEATVTAASTVAEAEARAAEVLDIADRRASEIVATAIAEAHERVLVAKADARDAVGHERARIEADLDLVAALTRRAEDDRTALDALRDDLKGTLGELGRILSDVAEDPVRAGQRLLETRAAEAASAEHDVDDADTVDDGEATGAGEALARSFEPLADLDAGESERLDSHTEFFSTEIEDDPSRKWILS